MKLLLRRRILARSLGLLYVLKSTPAVPSIASLASTLIYTVSLQSFMNNPG
jgi:hypothetical protein